jgi:hypothetical protein
MPENSETAFLHNVGIDKHNACSKDIKRWSFLKETAVKTGKHGLYKLKQILRSKNCPSGSVYPKHTHSKV